MVNSWVSPDELGASSNSPYAFEACQTASYILWGLSGRKFHGVRAVTETYEYPATSSGNSARIASFDMGLDVFPTLLNGQIYNSCTCAGCPGHQHLRLRGRPVQSVQAVRLGDSELASTDYWLENKAVLALPNSCRSQCSVTVSYTYGVQPPVAGRRAARYLAQQFVLSWEGSETCELPERVTSVSRQGVSYQLLDNGTFIDDMRTGVYGVDLFLKTVNPDNARRPARVFSPDTPSAKRVARHRPAQTDVGPFDLQVIPGLPYTWSVSLVEVGASLIDGTAYVPRGQVSTWNGATLFELDEDHFTIVGDTLTCTLTAQDTRRAQLNGRGVWDLYAISAADRSTSVHLLTSNVWLVSEHAPSL